MDASTILPDTTDDSSTEVIKEWVRFGRGLIFTLLTIKDCILGGEKLDHHHIDSAQNTLKQQFSEIGGLQSTLL